MDCGIASVRDSQVSPHSETTEVAGTIAYMAPEQLLRKPTAASDVFALGVIAYEMVTGRRPFNPDSPYQLLDLQRAGVRVKPVDLRPSLPEAAQSVILQALAYEQRDRPRHAREFGEALAHALTFDYEATTHSWAGPQRTGDISRHVRPSEYMRQSEHVYAYGESHVTAHQATTTTSIRVALLYKRNVQPDEHVLKLLESELSAYGYKVFIDRHLTIGVEWAKEIEKQVRTADAVIPLLSAASVASEMLAYEVQIAHEAAQ